MRIEALVGSAPRVVPERIALDDGTRTVTFGELAALVNGEAEFLRSTGGLRFALLADNGCGWVLADLALHHLNRLNVPLPRYFTESQLRHVIDDAGIDTLLTDGELASGSFHEFACLGRSPVSGLQVFRRDVADRPWVAADVTKVTYTSGSTGEPRGVCLSAATLDCVTRSLVAATAELHITRHLCLMPLPTLLENIAGVYAALRSGATCLVPGSAASGMSYGSLDHQKLLSTIARSQPQSLLLVPELLRLLVAAARAGFAVPKSLKFVAVGGAVVSNELLEEAAQAGIPVYEGYGLSECASVVCLNSPQAHRRGSVGRPLPHVKVRVGSGGQLFVAGAVMSGYLGDSRSHGLREIATGDIGEFDSDGFLYIRGRMRNLFITSMGRNVSPEWIERELTQQAGIRHAVAFGEAQPTVSALLSPSAGMDDAAVESAVQLANRRLPDYARVHRWFCMPEPPTFENGLLTANGRLRRDRVLALHARSLRVAG